jgi:hypothetical protein
MSERTEHLREVSEEAIVHDVALVQDLRDALRKAEAQKERCAGLTAGEWRAFFLQTQNQWAAAEDEVKRLREICRETAEAIDMFGWRYEGNRFMAAELREAMEACRRARG